MTPTLTFLFGMVILALFGWYFATELASRKRTLGLVLTILLVAFCIEQVWPPAKKIQLGLDLRGGTSFLLRLLPGEDTDTVITPDMLGQAVEVIRRRVDQYGVSEPVITPQGRDRILVQIAGLDADQIASAKQQLQRVAKLEFSLVPDDSEQRLAQIRSGKAILDPAFVILPYKRVVEGKEVVEELLVRKRPALTGDAVASAHAYFDNQGYGVALNLTSEGAKQFDEVARENKGRRMAIILDGEIQSAPVLQSDYYGGRATITGSFTEKEARNLASVLENPLKVPVRIEETRSVSASLGADSIRSGLLAGLLGMMLVLGFVLVYYRLAGIIAILGLIINIVLLFGMMGMFHFVLTLPGIAGIILTIGMAVDANVLIYERLREELKAGKSLPAALDGAYDKAFSAIFDANVTTLITSVILMSQATGSVRGFAVTLTLGIIASMFSALIFTRTVFRWALETGRLKKLSMLNLMPTKSFNFLGKRRAAMILSLVLILGSLTIIAFRGQNNLGIDFRGGDLVIFDSTSPVSIADVRKALEPIGLGNTPIFYEREGMKEMISVRGPQGSSQKIVETVLAAFPESGIKPVQEETVGAAIGAEFARRALWALALGILGILIYTTIRFEFGFALGAVVALIHDVVITLGVFSFIGGELSLVMVGAVLTVAGYSINDTIVVFDRIREGLRTGEKGSIQRVMNRSINDTLGRTILTSGTTMLSVAALYFFGGAVLRDFAFAILVGITVGTYSSIFIASPIVLWWAQMRGKSLRREVIESAAAQQAIG
jgi:SecD/SecF fusion protein